MASLRQRIAFLRRMPRRYLWYQVLRKLGKKRARCRRDGRQFFAALDTPGGIALIDPVETWMAPLLRTLLPIAPGTFVDVGANVGQTLLWLRCVDAERPWIGFEPSRDSCESIRGLIRHNDFSHTTLIQAGLSDKPGHGTLFAGGGTDSSATMIRDFSGKLAAQQTLELDVELKTGADVADNELAAKVGLLKVDVEGMELEVIRGLRPVIERDHPLIIFEVLPVQDDGSERAKRMLGRQGELTAELKSLGYRLVQIRPDASLHDVEIPRNDVDLASCNYLAIPSPRYAEIKAQPARAGVDLL